jgi:hypothetical protein
MLCGDSRPRPISARLLSGFLLSLVCGLLTIGMPDPAAAIVILDLHYQGQDEIELSALPADGRITLDLDISWDGEPQGLVGLGISTRFDPAAASFVAGTSNRTTLFANPYGGDGLMVAGGGGPPVIIRDAIEGRTGRPAPGWAINDVSTVNAIRLPAPDSPGLEAGAYSLTFDVRDVVTFDLLFGQGDALLFYPLGGALSSCYPTLSGAVGSPRYDQAGCVANGLVAFDGFRVVDGERSAPSPVAIFDRTVIPEPGAALLIGLGLGGLGAHARRSRLA